LSETPAEFAELPSRQVKRERNLPQSAESP
jgi:hypothetical protein